MFELAREFATQLNAGAVWYGVVLLGVFYILKKEPLKVLAHFSERKDRNLGQAVTLLENDKLSPEIRELLQEHVEREAFKKFYGIDAEKSVRTVLLDFYRRHSPEVRWRDLRRAFMNIRITEGRVSVHVSVVEKVLRFAVRLVSWAVGIYGVLIVAFGMHATTNGVIGSIGFTFAGMLLMLLALLFSALNWQYISSDKIEKAISRELDCAPKDKQAPDEQQKEAA